MFLASFEYADNAENCYGFHVRRLRDKRTVRALSGHKIGRRAMGESNMSLRGETWFLRAEIAGRKYRESLHTTNVREARKLRDARLKVIQAQARHGAVERTAAIAAWGEHVQGQISAATNQRYWQSLTLIYPLHLMTDARPN